MRKKGLRNKVLSIVLASSVILSSVQWNMTKEEAKAAVGGNIPKVVDEIQDFFYVDSGKGENGIEQRVWVDSNGNEVDELPGENSGSGLSKSAASQLPASYSMVTEKRLPAVRNQGMYGDCWAHGTIAAAESNMIIKGYADTSVDYSERHLAFFAHHVDPITGDGTEYYDDGFGWYGGGGPEMAIDMFAAWYGPALESKYPHSAYSAMEDIDISNQTDCAAHMKNAYEFDKTDIASVKNAIMNIGALTCAYYSDNTSVSPSTNAIYHASGTSVNHVVSIVGWDDNYAVSNFSGSTSGEVPTNKGAWLIRNSWGTNNGNVGYYWMSYEESTLCSIYGLDMDKVDNYDNIYQYDGRGEAGYRAGGQYRTANIFTSNGLEEIKAVSMNGWDGTEYTVSIYVGQNMSNPEDGNLVVTQSGTLSGTGYHTIDLTKSTTVDKGMQYSVVLKETSGSYSYGYLENSSSASANEGESFQCNGSSWEAVKVVDKYVNACIKVFTDKVEAIDKTELKKAIDAAKLLKEADYTSATWPTLCNALVAAESVYNNSAATSTQIIDADNVLNDAIQKLKQKNIYVTTGQQLEKIVSNINNGTEDYSDQVIKLKNNIDMSGITHVAIGNKTSPFNTTFDGCGYEIQNLTYSYDYSYGGFFGYIGENGKVSNVSVTNSNIVLNAPYCGAFVGYNNGNIDHCSLEGKVTLGYGITGSFTSYNNGIIKNCNIDGTITVTAEASSGCFIGGFASNNMNLLENCILSGSIDVQKDVLVGGIAGSNNSNGIISRCINKASISGSVNTNGATGGITCNNYGKISECINIGNITRVDTNAHNGAIFAWSQNLSGIANSYYLDTSCARGSYYPTTSLNRSQADFDNGKVSYDLNTSGGQVSNTKVWSVKNSIPVLADNSDNKAVVKITVSQNSSNPVSASLNEVTNGVIYAKAGDSIKLAVTAGTDISKVSVSGLTATSDITIYKVPEDDTNVTVTVSEDEIKHCTISFPDNGGLTFSSASGYDNKDIIEGNSYVFTISAVKGYDIAKANVYYNGTKIVPDNGLYIVSNVTASTNKITVDGITISNPSCLVDGKQGSEAIVSSTAVLTPVAPATKIKLASDSTYASSITVDTDKTVSVMVCDTYGNESKAFNVTFNTQTEGISSTTTISINKESVKYGDDVIVTADVKFSKASTGGVISFIDEDGYLLTTVRNLVQKDSTTMSAQWIIDTSTLSSTGDYYIRAVYSGDGTSNDGSLSETGKFTLNKATAINTASTWSYNETVSASDEMTMSQINEMINSTSSVRLVTDTDIPVNLPISFSTNDVYNAKGTTYNYTSTITGNDLIDVSSSLKLTGTITVTPEMITNPTFAQKTVNQGTGVVNASQLGTAILPTSGYVMTDSAVIVHYTIAWDSAASLDISVANKTETFTGTITYTDAPAWLTLPESSIVSRVVNVKESQVVVEPDDPSVEKIATTTTISFDKTNVKYGEEVNITAEVKFAKASDGGTITFEDEDGYELLIVDDLDQKDDYTVYTECVLDTKLLEALGTYGLKAVYSGAGTDNSDSESELGEFTLGKATAVKTESSWSFAKTIDASDKKTMRQINAIIGSTNSIKFVTDTGLTVSLPVSFTTNDTYNAKGKKYNYTASITGSELVDVSDTLNLTATITVTPETITNPVFEQGKINQGTGVKKAEDLGVGILPTSGYVITDSYEIVHYTIDWDSSLTIDISDANAEKTFTGTITYTDAPEWLTLPESSTVSRVVKVNEIASSVTTISYDKLSVKYGETIEITAKVTFSEPTFGGTITIVDEYGNELITVDDLDVEDDYTLYTVCTLDTGLLDEIGTYGLKAIYNGSDASSSESEVGQFTVNKSTVIKTSSIWSYSETLFAFEGKTMSQINAMINKTNNLNFVTDTGVTVKLPVSFSTKDTYNAKGKTYNYTAAITGNDLVDVSDSLTLTGKITVISEAIANPTFAQTYVNQGTGIKNATQLGTSVLPTSGYVMTDLSDNNIHYTIAWNSAVTIDTSVANQTKTFTGTIKYTDAPAWLTLPASSTVSRVVKIRQIIVVVPDDDDDDDDYLDDDDDDIYIPELSTPKAPASVAVKKMTKSSIKITWSKVSNADGYIIYRKTDSGAYKKYKTISSRNTISYTAKSLGTKSTYYFKVRAYRIGYYSNLYSGYSAGKYVNMKKDISSDELKINVTKYTLKVKKTKTLKVSYPTGRSSSQIVSIKYSSSKKSAAKVSSKGKITAVKKGTAKIKTTVKLKNGQTKTFTTTITVKK